MPQASATGDTYTYREQEVLDHFSRRGLLRYKDVDAYYCQACEITYNVRCPRCRTEGFQRHGQYPEFDALFKRSNGVFELWDGYIWTRVECSTCEYTFKVIVK